MSEGWRRARSGNWYHFNVCKGCSAHLPAICEECGEYFLDRKHKAKGKKGGCGRKFCSPSCSNAVTGREQDTSHLRPFDFKKERTPHNYRGWHFHSQGYITVMRRNNRKLEHRMVMERHLGRVLSPREVIHHVNGHKTDNRIDNLEVMSQSEHMRLHWEENRYAANQHQAGSW